MRMRWLVLWVGLAGGLLAQEVSIEGIRAEEEFRWGVRAFHLGFLHESILSFQKSLSYRSDLLQAHLWLGRAYLRSGFYDAALTEWEYVLSHGHAPPYLQYKYETVKRWVGVLPEEDYRISFVSVFQKEGREGERILFRNPAGVDVGPDGSIWIAAFGSNEVVHLSPTGRFVESFKGELGGFSAPFDVKLSPDGFLYVSEFMADRISVLDRYGRRVRSFGKRGMGPGALLGPQYLAFDEQGYVYVTEWGNRRVSKFTPEGEFLFSFGTGGSDFSGLQGPRGIAVRGGEVYVADTARGSIVVFDTEGNYLREMGKGLFREVETLYPSDGRFFLTAGDRLLLYDPSTGSLARVGELSARRLMGMARTPNGDLVVSDIDTDQVHFMVEVAAVYGGLYVDVERVDARDFPQVFVDVAVRDRDGRPLVGLENSNFLLTEGGRNPGEVRLVFQADRSARSEVALILEHSPDMRRYVDRLSSLVVSLLPPLSSQGSVAVFAAKDEPVLLAESGQEEPLSPDRLVEGAFPSRWRPDLALRQAAFQVLKYRGKRAVVFFSSGAFPPGAFSSYSIDTILGLFLQNEITLHVVDMSGGHTIPDELAYLVEKTGGEVFDPSAPRGLSDLAQRIGSQHSGRYVLSYTSISNPDFGRSFIPVEVEVRFFSRSGRDESGYFGPAQ
ncbi:hypothetical protein [Spirochaeta thermophila]|uniref:Tripartite motif-containing protein 71 n=1 Tax=Winmispira thermophila (strain ATCC 49972 / DSM 6192 / RI 19.B1) TaxID=665571 RepID=E0RTH3_WINT6|nr:hypothetical protein [Spirochaeta thermophila]ADN02204.1 tripartite motif-containing protein 71 [Spirochaeta thermophila DSM 6192]